VTSNNQSWSPETPPGSESPLTLTVLGSGSSGNAAVLGTPQGAVLLDCGFSGREIQRRLEASGIPESSIIGIVITHEHGDHVQSAHTLSNRFQIPIYATEGTFAASIASKKFFDWVEIKSGHAFSLASMDIHAITLPHDASDPVGFRFEYRNRICSYITDCGYLSAPVLEGLKGSHVTVVEANHDIEMLRNGPYPWPLKQRVASRTGHLSNEALFESLDCIIDVQTHKLILAHISENNNNPKLLTFQTRQRLTELGLGDLPFILADQHKPLASIEV